MADRCWYERVNTGAAELLQGHLLLRVKNADLGLDAADTKQRDFIVLSHSCDIPKVRMLLIARLQRISETSYHKKSPDMLQIAQGRSVRFFLLPPDATVDVKDYYIADFAELAVAPRDTVVSYVATNGGVRLTVPYIEHLGYSFGRVFARVGLEQNLWERGDWRWDTPS